MPPEATPLDQCPIATYWRQSPEKISQHWYISFCLMMSAIQDYLTGLCLEEYGNLSWATTCYYYSLVHTARLFSFCVAGDFPKRHIDLRNLYKAAYMPAEWKADLTSLSEVRAGSISCVRFDWLNDFSGQSRISVCPSDVSSQIDRLFSRHKDKYEDKLRSFSLRLNRLGLLRSDSTYEPLLIAHEKYHVEVTGCFKRLVRSARSAGSDAALLAIRAYRSYILRCPLLNSRRATFRLLSNQYVVGRLYASLIDKIKSCDKALRKLSSFRKTLVFQVRKTEELESQYQQIQDQINMEQFLSKTSQMYRFREKIENLERRDYERLF